MRNYPAWSHAGQPGQAHRRLAAVAILCLLLALALSSCSWAGFPFSAPSSRVLFIGNSFTFYNNGVDQELKGLDPSVAVKRLALPGYTLKDHWDKGQAADAIRSGHWDYVVLQEQSQLPVLDGAQFSTYAARFSQQIQAAGARPVLFMTWERPDSVQSGVTTNGLANAYYRAGNQSGAKVAPAGIAFANALSQQPHSALYGVDGHPTVPGTYLAACVIYATLFGKSPVGLSYAPSGMSAAQRDFLQRVAAQASGY